MKDQHQHQQHVSSEFGRACKSRKLPAKATPYRRTTTNRAFSQMSFSLIFLAISSAWLIRVVESCQISEYYCDNRKCVSLDKFCNGIDDCGDGSDEPRHCSPCNRTYYGDVDGTYTIAVHRPSSRESQQPFVCQLTFAAGGKKYGDLVQLIFNSVTLGPSSDQYQYDMNKSPSCKEGHVTLSEPDRPATDGHWCGHDWGEAVFFSETSRVTLTLTLLNVPPSPGMYAFDFRLTYKFLRKSDSSVRYGPPSRPYYRGQLLPGTFCSLIFNACDKLRCALQTPNFPGIYPRNVTCYYAIRQLNAPPGHRPVIQLEQEKDHMIFVRNRAVSKKNAPGSYPDAVGLLSSSDSSIGGKGQENELTIGDDCDISSDHVTIYDGYTIRDPVLLKFCGGGKFPTITSSGNELLMEFYSAPTDYLLQSAIYTAIQGFHVDVEIKYLPVGSHTYVENHNCLFTVSSFQQKRGFLTSPQHSLPSGAMCTYLLEGSPGEIVWISLLKFFVGKEYGKSGEESGGYSIAGLTASAASAGSTYLSGSSSGGGSGSSNYMSAASVECNTTYFQIWQGTYREKGSHNATLLAHLCEDTPVERTCEFMLRSSMKTPSRACHPDESFISTGPHMSLILKIDTTTVLRPAEFKLYYEFVDTRQGGEPFYHPVLSQTQNQMPNLPKPQAGKSSGTDPVSNPNYPNKQSAPKFPVESCSRIFRSKNRAIQAGSFTSPRNVFYFGRGGVTNLTCIYRFEAGRHERVKVTFSKISMDGGYCKSEVNAHTGRSMCRELVHSFNNGSALTQGRVQLWEAPWNDSRILKECLCEVPNGPLSFVSVSSSLDIVLQIEHMKAFHDQNHFIFEGRYEFIKHPHCARQQKLKSPSGSFTLRIPESASHQSCAYHPWEIQPQSPSHYIFLSVPGRTLRNFALVKKSRGSSGDSPLSYSRDSSGNTNHNSSRGKQQKPGKRCDHTRNRILVYSGGFSGKLLQIICPEDSSSASTNVHIFSPGWFTPEAYPSFSSQDFRLSMTNLQLSNQLIVEMVSRGPGSSADYELKYVQISRKDEPLDWRFKSKSSNVLLSGAVGLDGASPGVGGPEGDGFGGSRTKLPGEGDSTVNGGRSAHSSAGTSSSISSSPFNQVEDDVCFNFKCPELNACVSPSVFCDGVEDCPSGFDEEECEYFPIPKTYLVLVAASLLTFVVLSCCFGCLLCKKRRAERQEKLLMSSRTPTEEMFFGTGSSSTHREIVC